MDRVEQDLLFVALTRPQMFAGVTYSYFIANGIVATELFLIFRSPWALVAAVAAHLLGVVLCAVSMLGLTGAFGEIRSGGKLDTVVLFGVPLGLLAIGAGIVNGIRGRSGPGGPGIDDPAVEGDAEATGRDRPAPGSRSSPPQRRTRPAPRSRWYPPRTA